MIAKSCIWKYYVKNKKEKKNDRRRENSRMSALVIGSLLRFKHTYTLSGLPSLDGFEMAIFEKKKSKNSIFTSNDKINFSFQFLLIKSWQHCQDCKLWPGHGNRCEERYLRNMMSDFGSLHHIANMMVSSIRFSVSNLFRQSWKHWMM